MQQQEVVDVADVMAGADAVLAVLVQRIKVNICEELRRQIANRQAQVRRLIDQALVRRHARQQLGRAAQLVVLAWVVKQDRFGQAQPPRLADARGDLPAQHVLVDGDEEVGQVALEIERWPCPVLRDATDLRLEAFGRVHRAAPGDAGAGVLDERSVKARRDFVVQQVVHDPITEIGRPHLACFRARDDKADRAAGLIRAVLQLVVQFDQVALQVLLKHQGAGGIAFAAAAVEICDGQLLEREVRIGMICGRRGRGPRTSGCCCSGCHC